MKKRALNKVFHEPSLVPLADMLTNTVGIVLFILIFTVLTTGGVVVAKRLPMERSTEAKPLNFLCTDGRLLPLNDGLIDQFLEPLGKATYYLADAWITNFNARHVEDEYFLVKGDGKAHHLESAFQRSVLFDLLVDFMPRPGKGETIVDFRRSDSRFRQILKQHQPKDRFVHFFVRPDSLAVFEAARSVAVEEKNFGTGWMPLATNAPVGFTLNGGGIRQKPQN